MHVAVDVSGLFLHVCNCVCVRVVANVFWNVDLTSACFFVRAYALTFCGAGGYFKCRHGAVISEQGSKVSHNSTGLRQDLS